VKNFVCVSQAVIQFLVGLGAIVSGAMLVAVPAGSLLRMSPDMLKEAPFDDFLLPGIILFLVIGVGQVVGGVLTLRRHRSAGYLGAVLGIGLMIWIFVQVNMIGGRHILQYSYFMVGVIETGLSFLIQDHLSATRD
jgi:hypothetical protein